LVIVTYNITFGPKKAHSLDGDHKVPDFRVPIQIQIQK